jgi:hypothetical protein
VSIETTMSEKGQKRTNRRGPNSTVVGCCPKADKHGRGWNVRYVPLTSFAASQKSGEVFVISDEPSYDNRCRERAPSTTSIATIALQAMASTAPTSMALTCRWRLPKSH